MELKKRHSATFKPSDIVSVTADLSTGVIAWHVNGAFLVAGRADLTSEEFRFGCAMVHSSCQARIVPDGPALQPIPADAVLLDLTS